MTTEELVKQLVEYINAGENVKAEEELYADDVISVEQNGFTATGKQAIIEKTKGALDAFEQFHSGGVATAWVGADNFLLHFKMDVTPKGGERMEMVEYGYYKVKDGKISEEYFFMQPL